MNHIYDKFVIALDHSTNKITIYIHLKKEKTTNKMKVPRRKQKFIARNYVKVLLPKKNNTTRDDNFKGCKRVESHWKCSWIFIGTEEKKTQKKVHWIV